MHLTPHCKESALPFCKIQTTDQRRESRKGAGRKTTRKAWRERNEDQGQNTINRNGQRPFVLLEPEKAQRLTVIPDKMTQELRVGWAGKHFHRDELKVELSRGSHGLSLQLHDPRRSHPTNEHSTPLAVGSRSQKKCYSPWTWYDTYRLNNYLQSL